jgi:hypothetical protein
VDNYENVLKYIILMVVLCHESFFGSKIYQN